jgi:hypothetical protein
MEDLPPEPKTGERPVTRNELKGTLKRNDWKLWSGLSLTIFGMGYGAQAKLDSTVQSAVDAGLADIQAEQKQSKAELVKYQQSTDASFAEFKDRLQKIEAQQEKQQAETNTNFHELYKAMMFGQPSKRLERAPVRDGGK